VSGFAALGGPSSDHNAVEDEEGYQYPQPDVTVAKPPRRTGNVRIKPKAKQLLRRGVTSRDAVKRAPDLVIMIDRSYDRHGVHKADDVEGSTA
jgi:hypothetical protein